MSLSKLTLQVESDKGKSKDRPIEVLFNPTQLQISRVGWSHDEHTGLNPADQPATLSVELFFDTSLKSSILAVPNIGVEVLASPINPLSLSLIESAEDVRNYTQPIFDLTGKRGDQGKTNRPPICRLYWGEFNSLFNQGFFRGVLKDVTQTFSRFRRDGTPIRATLSCNFQEWTAASQNLKAINPVDDPTRIVKRGETLSSISQEEYGDPTLWRVIALENNLDNPRAIVPGQQLTVPPLRLNSGGR